MFNRMTFHSKNIFLRLGTSFKSSQLAYAFMAKVRERKTSQDETTEIFNCISMQADHANMLKVTFEEV